MSGKVFLLVLSFLIVSSFKTPGKDSLKKVLALYNRADKVFKGQNNSASADSLCLRDFQEVIIALNELPRTGITDSLMFQANYKLGILREEFRDYRGASTSYLYAVEYSTNSRDKFCIFVLTGTGFYNLNNFDSAAYYLHRAEEFPGDVGSSEDRVRLYNSLGVLYYDNGNYLQSKNYFNQALRLIESKDLVDDLKIYTQLNLATCSYKLGLYDQALTIYRKLQKDHLLPDALYLNMGKAYSGLHQYDAALSSYKKVKIASEPGVLNEMAKTAIETGNMTSAWTWLHQYQRERQSLHTNAMDDGVNELYLGDCFLIIDQPDSALVHLQSAINIFSRNFSDPDIRKYPTNFTGSFGYYRLFEVLAKKATAWERVYKKTSRPGDLRSAFDGYQSAIALLSYIERSYEMDDAKILLKQKSGELYIKALKVCIQLNGIYPKGNFLEAAFLISEKNKASVMSAQIRETNILLSEGEENDLAAKERNIKYNIARLNSKSEEGVNAAELQKINDEKAEYETSLVSLRKKMEGNKRFYQLKYSDDFPSIAELQGKMNTDQAVISFFIEPDKINVFLLTNSSLQYLLIDSGQLLTRNMLDWIDMLQTTQHRRNIKTAVLRKYLYEQFMKPLIELAGEKQDWIIVPDGLFFLLPLESLPGDDQGNPLIEKHSVSYEFSAKFVMEDKRPMRNSGLTYSAISFAPFTRQGADLHGEGMGVLEKLPFSGEEIAGLKGSQFMDEHANKESFIKNMNRFPIVHLATHAVTNLDNPSASYISFFPSAGKRAEDFLFLDEIYSLRMDSCRMIVISACETGKGELVRNEGVMSFARAFLYAGCPSTINTLWKADDRSTAEIIKGFYTYLDAGETKSKALQKAKLDFIRRNPMYRSPAYWSDIVIMGNADALYKKKQPWLWVTFVIGLIVISFFLINKRKKKKVDAFHSLIGLSKLIR
jgi:CHAT domain-containing protein